MLPRLLLVLAVICMVLDTSHAQSANELQCKSIAWPSEHVSPEMQSRFEFVDSHIKNDSRDDLQSVVVIKNGELVYESYPNGYTPYTINDIRSATKSIVSLLVGIAVDQGKIRLDDTMLSFFPEYNTAEDVDERKKRITIDHLLTMASGLYADSDDPDSPGNEDYLYESDDWKEFAMEIPMAWEPGTHWAYASLNTFILGMVLEKATGQQLEDFAQTYLLDPLGIEEYRWTFTPKGWVVAQGNFFIGGRDLAKIGQLVLNDGCWEGKQLISKDWLEASFQDRYPVSWSNYDSYGYKWYNHTLRTYHNRYAYTFASGNGGNKLYMVPEEDLVVAILSTAYNTRYAHPRSLDIFERILETLDHY